MLTYCVPCRQKGNDRRISALALFGPATHWIRLLKQFGRIARAGSDNETALRHLLSPV